MPKGKSRITVAAACWGFQNKGVVCDLGRFQDQSISPKFFSHHRPVWTISPDAITWFSGCSISAVRRLYSHRCMPSLIILNEFTLAQSDSAQVAETFFPKWLSGLGCTAAQVQFHCKRGEYACGFWMLLIFIRKTVQRQSIMQNWEQMLTRLCQNRKGDVHKPMKLGYWHQSFHIRVKSSEKLQNTST